MLLRPTALLSLVALAVASVAYTAPGDSMETVVRLLSGTGSDDTVDWEFHINGGRKANHWSTIPVPSCWETQGFGTYHYSNDWTNKQAPDTLGRYRHTLNVPSEWRDRQVDLVFGGVMTDAEVRLNGQPAGPIHQGGFYAFRHDVTALLRWDGEPNVLEVDVHKISGNPSVNRAERDADFWLFGGIFRPVWLESRPLQHIDRLAVDARADGTFTIEVHHSALSPHATLVARVTTLDGQLLTATTPVNATATGDPTRLDGRAPGIAPWSAEWPHRYRLHVELRQGDTIVHTVAETIGFRTFEVRPHDGLFLNGKRIILKGANRHSFWPTTGRTTSAALSEADVRLIKAMNMNAVRMSHYPPDPHFLEACDRLGLYVIDELTGWQKAYDSEVGPQLVAETVTRDVNHPSIILWANGNEGGWNTDLDDDFALYDPQRRTVIHPWDNFNGINTSHYEDYDAGPNTFFHGEDIFMPTEFLHGLYDGGHGAGLDDWWKLTLNHPLGAGGFLWSLVDEGLVRDDQGGRIDVAGNRGPDGILGPYREKEASFYTIKEIWSPVYLPRAEVDNLPASFDGRWRIENRYAFTSLDRLSFRWRTWHLTGTSPVDATLVSTAEGTVTGPAIAPGHVGELTLDLPSNWAADNDIFELTVSAPQGEEIYSWRWSLTPAAVVAARFTPAAPTPETARIVENDTDVSLGVGDLVITLRKSDGQLDYVHLEGVAQALRNGPIILDGESKLTALNSDPSTASITARYDGPLHFARWTLLPDNWLRLDYEYGYRDNHPRDYLGVTFDFPESGITGVRWLGKGPYRVWKNRRKGVEFGLWHKDWNDTLTGQSWAYPEFKGFHDDVVFAVLEHPQTPLQIVVANDNVDVRWFSPSDAFEPRQTQVAFPPGDLSFLQGIAPIGTKFKAPTRLGPSGQPNYIARGGQVFAVTVYFHFGLTP